VRILGVDTATWRASVGVVVDGEVAAEQSQLADSSHAVSLLPLIANVLRAAGCTIEELDGVAVSSGPGSFTGLRIGLSVAKGLGRATGAHVVGIPTLEALARTVADRRGAICAALDARKGEVYAACFDANDDHWRRLTPDLLLTPESLVGTLPAPCTVLGDAVQVYGDLLRTRLGSRATLLPFDTYAPRGGVVATLGWERLRAGTAASLPELEPDYVRPPEAEVNAARS
jgi:tRNA threonylcarbamoyladenosine biosynthesis protein TsaB